MNRALTGAIALIEEILPKNIAQPVVMFKLARRSVTSNLSTELSRR